MYTKVVGFTCNRCGPVTDAKHLSDSVNEDCQTLTAERLPFTWEDYAVDAYVECACGNKYFGLKEYMSHIRIAHDHEM